MENQLISPVLPIKKVLFYRNIIAPHGGHQKVANYFEHVRAASGFWADIAFSNETRWDVANPWFPSYKTQAVAFESNNYDIVFLAGMDWQVYKSARRPAGQPVINLIQHVRHADPNEDVYQFLSEPAIRVCVSQSVTDAILHTGCVNGPVVTIENGLSLPDIMIERCWDVIILGIKQPLLAERLAAFLVEQGLSVKLIATWIQREQLFHEMSSSRIALLLPNSTEGFYLPALEAMKFAELTIVPDCIGNRSFCHHGENCFIPEYSFDALIESVMNALQIMGDVKRMQRIQSNARMTIERHSLMRERSEFINILNNIDSLWAQVCRN